MDIDMVLNQIKEDYDDLEQKARECGNEFRAWLDQENEGKDITSRSTLLVRVRRRGDHALSVMWCYVRFFRTREGKWLPRTKEISSGRSLQYTESKLTRYAVGWELEEVMRTERKLARIRRRRSALGKLVRSVKAYDRECRKPIDAGDEA